MGASPSGERATPTRKSQDLCYTMGACRSVEGNLGPSNREDPKNPLLVCYRVKYLKLEFFVTITMLGKYLYTPLYEQYYFNNYGAYLLKNTSFLFPNHSFCVSSDMINLYLSDNNSYKLDETYSSDLVAYGEIVNRFPAILTTLILGPLTDRLGRRIGLFFPTLGITLQGILSIIIIYFDLNPYYFILANFVGGIFGNTAAILASAFSYIADTSSPRWRSLRIGAVESALAFGEGFGQFLGGYWLQSINCNFIPPMVLYIGCNIFLMVYIIFIPESLTTTERKEIVKKNPKGIKAYMEGLRIFSGRLSLSSTWKLYATFISVNILLFNILGAKLISVYFLKAIPFSFNALQIGFYQSIKSISQGISILIFVGILTILSKSDAWIMFVSAVVNVTCNILTGFSRKAWQVYAGKVKSNFLP